MKHLLSFLFLLASVASFAQPHDFSHGIEIRGSAFFPTSHRFKKIYGSISPSSAIETVGKFTDCLYGWGNVDWYSKRGKSYPFHDCTSIKMANFSLGIKYAYRFCENYYPYAGLGPSIAGVWIHNHSLCDKRASHAAYGLVLKSGIYFVLPKQLYLDVFVDYLYLQAHFTKKTDLSGLRIGVGFGGRF